MSWSSLSKSEAKTIELGKDSRPDGLKDPETGELIDLSVLLIVVGFQMIGVVGR